MTESKKFRFAFLLPILAGAVVAFCMGLRTVHGSIFCFASSGAALLLAGAIWYGNSRNRNA
jgi:hypothetical protein